MGDQDGSRLLGIRSSQPYVVSLEFVKSLECSVVVKRRDISSSLSLARESRANQTTIPPSSTFPPRAYCDCTFVRSFFRAFLRTCLGTAVPFRCLTQSGNF